MDKVSDVTTLVRALTDDAEVIGGKVYTDVVLLPFLNSAYRALQSELADAGISTVQKRTPAALVLPALTTEISTVSWPALPDDLVVPYRLWESADTVNWFAMRQNRSGIELYTSPMYREEWEWRDNKICFRTAIGQLYVIILYEKVLDALTTSPDADIELYRAIEPLAHATAAMAARSRGVTQLANDMDTLYKADVKSIVDRHDRLGGRQLTRWPRRLNTPVQ